MNENPLLSKENISKDSSINTGNTKKKTFTREVIELLIISIVIVVPFRMFVAQPFIVEGSSMYPTFERGNYLVVDEISWRFSDPKRGDVVVFKYPGDPKKNFIKRIIGMPGEIVSIDKGNVIITSNEYPKGLEIEESYVKYPKEENMKFTLGQDEYFVMGDNRAQSADSRIWGAVPAKNIIGRPILRLYPPSIMPGELSYFSNIKAEN